MSEKIGCGVTYTFCNHDKKKDCGDAARSIMFTDHRHQKCGEVLTSFSTDHVGIVAGIENYPHSWNSWNWFCSLECYQKTPENKKIKLEKF